MYNIPDLPQVPPSSELLRALWPRLQVYAIRTRQDPLWPICDDGTAGNETAAVVCLTSWKQRIPQLQAQLQVVREALQAALPNEDEQGRPFSGSYWAETDYDETSFQQSHWGTSYPRLLAVKDLCVHAPKCFRKCQPPTYRVARHPRVVYIRSSPPPTPTNDRFPNRYDPDGLFVCHHCVGSERWTKESNYNCRVAESLTPTGRPSPE